MARVEATVASPLLSHEDRDAATHHATEVHDHQHQRKRSVDEVRLMRTSISNRCERNTATEIGHRDEQKRKP